MALKLQDIPLSIKDHFGSERSILLLKEISRKAQIADPGLIPGMIYVLITKDVTAHDFIEALQEDGGLSKVRALAVAKEIKERVLEPVRRDLFRWGIDISAINVISAPDLKSIEIEGVEDGARNTSIPLSEFSEKPSAVIPITQDSTKFNVQSLGTEEKIEPKEISVPTTEEGPLILHQEITSPPTTEKEEKKKSFKGFSFGFGLFNKKSEVPNSPVIAKLEIPENRWKTKGAVFGKKEKEDDRKTVNYSEYRTPVSPLGEAEGELSEMMRAGNAAKAEAQEKTIPSAHIEAPAKPNLNVPPQDSGRQESVNKFFWFKKNEAPQKSESGPTLEGNKIDLRNKPITDNQ